MVWRVVFDGVKDDNGDGDDNDHDYNYDNDDGDDYDNDYNTEQKSPAIVRNLLFFDTFRTVQSISMREFIQWWRWRWPRSVWFVHSFPPLQGEMEGALSDRFEYKHFQCEDNIVKRHQLL